VGPASCKWSGSTASLDAAYPFLAQIRNAVSRTFANVAASPMR
jgi:hypothetical protein